jgi:hypothetical protein
MFHHGSSYPSALIPGVYSKLIKHRNFRPQVPGMLRGFTSVAQHDRSDNLIAYKRDKTRSYSYTLRRIFDGLMGPPVSKPQISELLIGAMDQIRKCLERIAF